MTQNYLVNKNETVLAWKNKGENDADGYCVKDGAGNVTWQSEEEFLKYHLPLGHLDAHKPHVQRMIIEKAQLGHRTDALFAFLKNARQGELPAGMSQGDIALLADQGSVMDKYLAILTKRVMISGEKRVRANGLSLGTGRFNVIGSINYPVTGSEAFDITDTLGSISIANVYTEDGIQVAHNLEQLDTPEGVREVRYALTFPGARSAVLVSVDRERAVVSVEVPADLTTSLFYDLEVVVENPNRQ